MPTGRFETMREWVNDAISAQRNELLSLSPAQGKGILQSHQLIDEFLKTVKVDGTTKDLKNHPFMKVLQSAEEAIVLPLFVALAIRPRPGVRVYVRVNVYELSVDHLTVSEYLRCKEELVNGHANGNYLLELDFEPFKATVPRPTHSSSIGNGVQFLKDSMEPLLEFLRTHKHDGRPAFYKAFGLTVVESMTCGLPTFATCHGGPTEIIENGVSGFHIDPYHPYHVAATLVSFFKTCNTDPKHWRKISDGGLKRIYERFTWKKYSERPLTLAGVYAFWKHVSKLERRETRRYLEMFYSPKFRDLANSIPLATDEH